MALYALSDLHLSHANDKPMDIFGENWKNHTQKIFENWNSTVSENDTVLVAGDISWAAKLDEAKQDLDFISELKGKKVLICGNHDYFWNSTARLNDMYDNMFFVKNSYYDYNGIAICGTRGWICPNDTLFTDHDLKIYNRDVNRLRTSLEAAKQKGYKEIVAMLHFPPTNDKKEISGFVELFKEYDVKKVVYGHLHNEDYFHNSLIGEVDGIEYFLTSADYLDFTPVKIL
jgi:hypothetical protein